MYGKRRYNNAFRPANVPMKRVRSATPYSQRFVAVSGRRANAPPATRGYRLNAVERKVNDIDTATYQVNTTGTFTLLALPTVGADFNQRVGRKIMLRTVYIKGRVQCENAGSLSPTATTSQQCRMIIFADLQPNGAAPAVTDLLVSATPASQLNLNNRDRFKIYCDKEFYLDPFLIPAAGTSMYLNRSGQVLKKFKKIQLETIFSTSTGSISDITSGALYMFWIGSAPAGANTDANFIGSTRVRYTDN